RRVLEKRTEGTFTFTGANGSRALTLDAVADRIDVLDMADGAALRVVDYKLGRPPDASLALQLPVYGIALSQRLAEEEGVDRDIAAAAYFSFNDRHDPVVYEGERITKLLEDGQTRLIATVEAIERGEFPPRPHKPQECTWCAYTAICRKEYAGEE